MATKGSGPVKQYKNPIITKGKTFSISFRWHLKFQEIFNQFLQKFTNLTIFVPSNAFDFFIAKLDFCFTFVAKSRVFFVCKNLWFLTDQSEFKYGSIYWNLSLFRKQKNNKQNNKQYNNQYNKQYINFAYNKTDLLGQS